MFYREDEDGYDCGPSRLVYATWNGLKIYVAIAVCGVILWALVRMIA